jgi:hypothetical protein
MNPIEMYFGFIILNVRPRNGNDTAEDGLTIATK